MNKAVPIEIMDVELDLGTSQFKPPVCKREVQTRTRLRAAIWRTILYFYHLPIIASCLIQCNTKYHMQVLFELKCLMNLPKSLVLLCIILTKIYTFLTEGRSYQEEENDLMSLYSLFVVTTFKI